ncbi:MAG: hypothetical protein JWN71_1439, partial [Xanthobacteraceae bacterium]|nr:hypothetical protein [Xanthobacteraceae bacterium]
MSQFGVGRFGQKNPSATDAPDKANTPEKPNTFAQPKTRRALGIMQLEPRIMFDGAAVASVDHHDSSAPASDGAGAAAAPAAEHAADNGSKTAPAATAPNQTNAPGPSDEKATPPTDASHTEPAATPTAHEVVFIDSRVPDLQTLIAGVAPGVDVHVLDADRDGVQQIADYLAANHLTDLSAIQIVSHGSQGAIQLGSTELNGNNLAEHAAALADIGAALSADGDIALYGCDVASQQGQQFIAALSGYTGADIAASTDATGHTALGGNWTLEATTGAIEAATPFSAAATASYQHVLADTLTTTQVTILTGDTDGDGVVDPNETVTTTVTITNNSTTTAAINVQLNETLDRMTLVPGSVKITPIAFNDSGAAFTLTGNTPMTFTAAQLLANDVDPDGLQTNLVVDSVSNAQHGTVSLLAGVITFTPELGYEGTASFEYTIKDSQGLNSVSTGVVTLTVTDPVWYVDATNGNDFTGDGTYNNPFSSLAPINTGGSFDTGLQGDDINDTIFVYDRGAAAYNSGIALETGQRLFGDGHAFVVNGLTIGASTSNSIINNAAVGVTLATGNTIDGLTINGTANTAIGISDGGAAVGNLTITNTSLTGQGKAIDIDEGGNLNVTIASLTSTNSTTEGVQLAASAVDALTGSFTVTSGSVSGSTGAALLIGDGAGGANTGGAVAISFGASLAGGTGRTVDIQDRVAGAGSITLSGAINHNVAGQTGIVLDDNAAGAITFSNTTKVVNSGSATAVSLTDNTGANINFINGGLDIDTTSGIGFLATGGGIINVIGANNSVTTQTGRIINWDGVSVGGSGVLFNTLQSTGTVAGDAISLNNVDGAGNTFSATNVTIAATSGAVSDGIAITGGSAANFSFGTTTIDDTAGHGINLNGANGTVSFSTVNIDGAAGAGISITGNTNTVSVNGGGIGSSNDPAGRGVDIDGGSADISIAASITKTTAGKIVEVTNRTAGTVTFSGTLNASGGVDNGINISGNTGGTIEFSAVANSIST